jgi:Mce-associated membrane protein
VPATIFIAAIVFAAVTTRLYLADRALADAKRVVVQTATDAVTTLWTYTPDNIDKLAERSARYLAGDFQAQYSKFLDSIIFANKQAQITNTTQVLGAGVESLDGSDATALVYTNTTSTSPQTKNVPALKYLSYRLFMHKNDSRWWVTKMNAVTALDLQPTGQKPS